MVIICWFVNRPLNRQQEEKKLKWFFTKNLTDFLCPSVYPCDKLSKIMINVSLCLQYFLKLSNSVIFLSLLLVWHHFLYRSFNITHSLAARKVNKNTSAAHVYTSWQVKITIIISHGPYNGVYSWMNIKRCKDTSLLY